MYFGGGTDNQLWEGFYNGTIWIGPQSLGMGPVGSPPSVAVLPSNEQGVVWRAPTLTSGCRGGPAAPGWEGYRPGGLTWTGPKSLGMGPLG